MRTPLYLLALLALPAFAQSTFAPASGLDSERLKMIHPRLQELVDNQTIPGAVALVARHGKVAILEAAGWRDVEGKKPMTTDSIFQIMSMTKNFTGVAIMMLVEEGKIELRRPIADCLPEFRGIQIGEHRVGPENVHPPEH